MEGDDARMVGNKPYDEAVEVSDSESVRDSLDSTQGSGDGDAESGSVNSSGASQHIGDMQDGYERGDTPPLGAAERDADFDEPETSDDDLLQAPAQHNSGKGSASYERGGSTTNAGAAGGAGGGGGLEDESSEDEDFDMRPRNSAGYNPEDYADIPVSSEVKELFEYITRFKAAEIELETRLRPFIPEYIPAVGDIDAFIRVPRPDGTEHLGLTILDEPAAKQTDPTVLELQLRSITKQSNMQPMVVRSIENADKNTRGVASWVERINELHRSKAPPSVHYTKNMPDIETLLQEWPPDFEPFLDTTQLPSAELDLELGDYVKVVCALMDIPYYNNSVESLHVFFTLYSEFKDNQHFHLQALPDATVPSAPRE